MVILCPDTYPEPSLYDSYFNTFSFPLSSFQKHAIENLILGNNVLITAHTGSGKTLPSLFAIDYFHKKGQKIYYTAPIKALSNQKFYEFTQKFPHLSIGLMTGDIKVNPTADVVIMTTEILMNALFHTSSSHEKRQDKTLDFQLYPDEIGCVVFDEVHFLNDESRGQNYEKTLMMLPSTTQILMLSATLDKSEQFANWCESVHKRHVALCSTSTRIVPLTHYAFVTINEGFYKLLKDKTTEANIRGQIRHLIPLQLPQRNEFIDKNYHEIVKTLDLVYKKTQHSVNQVFVLNQIIHYCNENDMLPAIVFAFSRKKVEQYAKEITTIVLPDDSKIFYTMRRDCESILRNKLPNYREFLELPEYLDLVSLLEKGIGIHHSGMIPILREMVEFMISQNKIRVLFATESFSVGLDCPIKSTIFTNYYKFDGDSERVLHSHEYTQMAGRAGRRGIDTVGNVIHCVNLYKKLPSLVEFKNMLGGRAQVLSSKLRITPEMLLSLAVESPPLTYQTFQQFHQKSMMWREHENLLLAEQTKVIQQRQEWNLFAPSTLTPHDKVLIYLDIEKNIKSLPSKKRKEKERQLVDLEDEYRFMKKDVDRWRQHVKEEQSILRDEKVVEELRNRWEYEFQNVLEVLIIHHFIDEKGNLLPKGIRANRLHESPGLIVVDWMFVSFSTRTLSTRCWVGIFSCFCDIQVLDPHPWPCLDSDDDENFHRGLTDLYDCVLKYENVISTNTFKPCWDMVEELMLWYDAETEEECKYLLQNRVANKGVSCGDFTKGCLKIVAVCREWIVMLEWDDDSATSNVELIHVLSQIEPRLLKYIASNQSLYV